MSSKNNIANTIEMEKRQQLAKEFYDAILDPYEHPWLVTDEASLYDITLDEEDELIKKINIYYGINLEITTLSMPFWKLLDYLQTNRVR